MHSLDLSDREITPSLLARTVWKEIFGRKRPNNLDDFLCDLEKFKEQFANPLFSTYFYWVESENSTEICDYPEENGILVFWDAKKKTLEFARV